MEATKFLAALVAEALKKSRLCVFYCGKELATGRAVEISKEDFDSDADKYGKDKILADLKESGFEVYLDHTVTRRIWD